MAARLLDGKRHAAEIREEVAAQTASLAARLGRPPGLAAVLVGDNPASQRYVRHKQKDCQKVGIVSELIKLPAETSQDQLLAQVSKLNANAATDGILVQLPLPEQIAPQTIIAAVAPEKDVDAFHPFNVGLMTLGRARFLPCTPAGIQQLLIRENITTEGAHAVVVGRSDIVGKPMALLLMQKGPGGNATVTVCHSRTPNLSQLTKQADLLVAAIGQAEVITAEMVKPGAVVIDVGINQTPTGQLVGDVHFPSVSQVASAITPVPGGVGPLTRAMLLKNTLSAAGRLLSD